MLCKDRPKPSELPLEKVYLQNCFIILFPWPAQATSLLVRDAPSQLVQGSMVTTQVSEVEAARACLEEQISQSYDGNVLLLCKQCRSTVAALRFCTGSSRHFNPHGYLFHIGEFSRAAGVKAVGEAYDTDSWFEGYAWRMGVCRHCQTHLGWRYEGAVNSGTFWGLIWNRMLKARRPDR